MSDKLHDVRVRRGRRAWNLASVGDGRVSDRVGAPLHEMAVKHLDLQAGQAVLDIGCGSGTMLARALDAVGPGGRLVGVDLSPRMLRKAHRRLDGMSNVELHEADASRSPLGTTSSTPPSRWHPCPPCPTSARR